MTLTTKLILIAALILSIIIPFGYYLIGERNRKKYKRAIGTNVFFFFGAFVITSIMMFAGPQVQAADAAAASKKFSMLILPATSVDSKVKATFTIDEVDYDLNLTKPEASSDKWDQGKNYIYTVKLSGQGLAINKVTVTDWTEKVVDGDLEIK